MNTIEKLINELNKSFEGTNWKTLEPNPFRKITWCLAKHNNRTKINVKGSDEKTYKFKRLKELPDTFICYFNNEEEADIIRQTLANGFKISAVKCISDKKYDINNIFSGIFITITLSEAQKFYSLKNKM